MNRPMIWASSYLQKDNLSVRSRKCVLQTPNGLDHSCKTDTEFQRTKWMEFGNDRNRIMSLLVCSQKHFSLLILEFDVIFQKSRIACRSRSVRFESPISPSNRIESHQSNVIIESNQIQWGIIRFPCLKCNDPVSKPLGRPSLLLPFNSTLLIKEVSILSFNHARCY